jgi:hypothetical protein
MKSLWNSVDRQQILDRVSVLDPSHQRRWGKFTCEQMICHLADALRMTTGELKIPLRHTPLAWFPIKQLVIYTLPFPKGAPTAPELLQPKSGEFDSKVADLREMIGRFSQLQGKMSEWPAHPAFGAMTERSWGVLAYRHIDHHLRQFGA